MFGEFALIAEAEYDSHTERAYVAVPSGCHNDGDGGEIITSARCFTFRFRDAKLVHLRSNKKLSGTARHALKEQRSNCKRVEAYRELLALSFDQRLATVIVRIQKLAFCCDLQKRMATPPMLVAIDGY